MVSMANSLEDEIQKHDRRVRAKPEKVPDVKISRKQFLFVSVWVVPRQNSFAAGEEKEESEEDVDDNDGKAI